MPALGRNRKQEEVRGDGDVMKILISGFEGNTNTSRIITEKIKSINISEKLYLINSFKSSVNQLEDMLQKHTFDLIIAFGQKPKIKSICLEQKACVCGQELVTDFEYKDLADFLTNQGYQIEVSDNAGNYLCNNIFYAGLRYINNYCLNTRMIFIHIPTIENMNNIDYLAESFSQYVDRL